MRYQVGSVIENAAASIQGCNNSSVKTSNPAAYITDPAKLEMLRSMKDLDNGGGKKSISMVDSYWLGLKKGFYTDGESDLSVMMALPYALMDGINEDGLAVAVLHLGGDATIQDTPGKRNIITSVIPNEDSQDPEKITNAQKISYSYNAYAGHKFEPITISYEIWAVNDTKGFDYHLVHQELRAENSLLVCGPKKERDWNEYRVNVYCDGLPVADAPQTQIGASAKFILPAGFSASADWQFNDRMYADFDPLARNSPDDRQYSYRIPGYQLVGASVSWAYEWKYGAKPTRKIGLNVFMRGDNLLNTTYIERGKDGTTHDLASFRGCWGFGRMFSLGIRVGIQ